MDTLPVAEDTQRGAVVADIVAYELAYATLFCIFLGRLWGIEGILGSASL